MHACMYVCVCVCVCLYVRMYVCMYANRRMILNTNNTVSSKQNITDLSRSITKQYLSNNHNKNLSGVKRHPAQGLKAKLYNVQLKADPSKENIKGPYTA